MIIILIIIRVIIYWSTRQVIVLVLICVVSRQDRRICVLPQRMQVQRLSRVHLQWACAPDSWYPLIPSL
jgi:hypothetical protein